MGWTWRRNISVNHATAPVVSTSYGSCRAGDGGNRVIVLQRLWEQAASQGMSAFVPRAMRAQRAEYRLKCGGFGAAVNGTCAAPLLDRVGGTEFNEGSYGAQYWAHQHIEFKVRRWLHFLKRCGMRAGPMARRAVGFGGDRARCTHSQRGKKE